MRANSFIKEDFHKLEIYSQERNALDSTVWGLLKKKKAMIALMGGFFILTFLAFVFMQSKVNEISISDSDSIKLSDVQINAAINSSSVLSIPQGIVKANPFLPYREVEKKRKNDVPEFELVEPPVDVNENSDAARVMDTVVSGILYDKFSPSAILNIEGNDYLVKKGDVVNNYKVLNIMQNSVTVQLGANVYTAGIGEILTEGSITSNNVSNLNNKFGGKK